MDEEEKTIAERVLGWDIGATPPRGWRGYFHDLLEEDWFKEGEKEEVEK